MWWASPAPASRHCSRTQVRDRVATAQDCAAFFSWTDSVHACDEARVHVHQLCWSHHTARMPRYRVYSHARYVPVHTGLSHRRAVPDDLVIMHFSSAGFDASDPIRMMQRESLFTLCVCKCVCVQVYVCACLCMHACGHKMGVCVHLFMHVSAPLQK